jgi:tetratricopeptide (TPR) repeat protein
MRHALLLLPLLLSGCASSARSGDVEAESLLGQDLRRPALKPEREAELDDDLRAARTALEAAPADELAAIWVGRRLAYLGRYRAAIASYTQSLERHPESYRLLRHRGHRYISVREFELAARDLERAASLSAGLPDEIEPDGAPNKYGIPRSTTQSNIHYHLGLAHYLLGEFEAALAAFERCLEFSRVNDDMYVATANWVYASARRSGHSERAAALLDTIQSEMQVIENHGYHHLLLMFKGEMTRDELLKPTTDGVASATVIYGVANWSACNGDEQYAVRLFDHIVAQDAWAAFGHIAAEADLARRQRNARYWEREEP